MADNTVRQLKDWRFNVANDEYSDIDWIRKRRIAVVGAASSR